MRIKVSGEPDKASIDTCRKAIRYFGKQLLTSSTYKTTTIKLIFTDIKKAKAECECYIEQRPRFFRIYINPNMGTRQTLLALAHEMVHVKQRATGELRDYVYHKNKCRFRGKVYKVEDCLQRYWLKEPWEIEAYGRQIGLYETFMMR